MGEGIDDAGTDTKTGKGTRTRHKSNFGDILEVFMILL